VSKFEEKMMYTLIGFALGIGNIVATSYGYRKIGIGFGIIGLVYFIRALRIQPSKDDK
jgi:hypothetical protein